MTDDWVKFGMSYDMKWSQSGKIYHVTSYVTSWYYKKLSLSPNSKIKKVDISQNENHSL